MIDYFQIETDIEMLQALIQHPELENNPEYTEMLNRLELECFEDMSVVSNESLSTTMAGALVRKALHVIYRAGVAKIWKVHTEYELISNLSLAERALVKQANAKQLRIYDFLNNTSKLPKCSDLPRIVSQISTLTSAFKKIYTNEIWSGSGDVITPAMKTVIDIGRANKITSKKDLNTVHSFSLPFIYSVWNNEFGKHSAYPKDCGYTEQNAYSSISSAFKSMSSTLRAYGPLELCETDLMAAIDKFHIKLSDGRLSDFRLIWQRLCTTYQICGIYHFIVRSMYVSLLKAITALTGEHIIIGSPDVVASTSKQNHW